MRKIADSSKVAEQNSVELLRRGKVAAEGLFDDDAGALRCSPTWRAVPRPARTARAGWRGSAPAAGRSRVPCGWPGRLPGRCSRRPRNAAEPQSFSNAAGSTPAVLLEAVARPRLELVEVPAGLGHADDRHVEVAALDHRLQRRKDLLVSQIARRAEENQRVGMGFSHGRSSCDKPPRTHRVGGRLAALSRSEFSTVTCSLPGVRRTRSAWPTAACPESPPRRAS